MEENTQLKTLWDAVKEKARPLINPFVFGSFIDNLVPVDIVNRKLVLQAETDLAANSASKSLQKLKEAAIAADVGLIDVILTVEGSTEFALEEMPDALEEQDSHLNPNYTFDTFVVGTSNKFVFAAAQSVAAAPGENFNPLYIWGATGLGKTHLLQAIANEIQRSKPSLKVLYTTSEKFLNEYVDSMYNKKGAARSREMQFRNRYRNVDVLLIDDIQFWAGKHGVQEAFFHAFNELYAKNKQIIISSDCKASDLTTLEERLRTRFDSGLIADIQPPNLETKIAILRQKALERKCVMPDDVLSFLAKNSDENVRTLEGRLNTVIFASKLYESPITVALARSALQDSVGEADEQEEITPDAIIRATCTYFSLTKEQLVGKSKRQEYVRARQICIYLMNDLLALPLVTIGKIMGGRDHSTVIHARDRISEQMRVSDTLVKNVNDIKSAVLKQ